MKNKLPYEITSKAIKGYSESPIAKSESNDCVVRAIASSFEIDYDVAQKGRIDPLIRNIDYLVADDFWDFISGNKNCMKYLKEAIIQANTEFGLYEDIKYFIDKYK